MTRKHNRERIVGFLEAISPRRTRWVSRQWIANKLGVKRVDKWETELLQQLVEQGRIECRQRVHPKSHRPFYEYRNKYRRTPKDYR